MSVTAYKYPGTVVNVDLDGKADWANPGNAAASDDSWATVSVAKSQYSDYLRATNFGFSAADIPAGSTIDGIELVIERHSGATGNYDNKLYLRKTSAQTGDNKASASYWPTSDAEATYGGAADKWNAALSQSDIVSSDFGVELSVSNSTTGAVTESVDCFKIRIYYTAGETPPATYKRRILVGG